MSPPCQQESNSWPADLQDNALTTKPTSRRKIRGMWGGGAGGGGEENPMSTEARSQEFSPDTAVFLPPSSVNVFSLQKYNLNKCNLNSVRIIAELSLRTYWHTSWGTRQ